MSDSELHPFGPGSHAPFEDIHQMPECHPIKGNADSMKYHRPDSHSYKVTGAEVWFSSPAVAEAAGFVLAGSHPKFSSSADFEPGSSGHPCTAAEVDAILAGGSAGGSGAADATSSGGDVRDTVVAGADATGSSGGDVRDTVVAGADAATSGGGDVRQTVVAAAGAGGVAAAATGGAAGSDDADADSADAGSGDADSGDAGAGDEMHPYGPGSHAPLADENEMPACYPIKGNVDSMKFHRPDSRSYGATIAEMWFASPSAAEAAGFELAGSHPKDSSSADYEPGGSGHPCTVAEFDAIMAGDAGAGAETGTGSTAGMAAAAGGAAVVGAAAMASGGDDDVADAAGDVRQTLGATAGAGASATAGDVRDTVIVDSGSGDSGGGDDASTGFAEGDEPFGPGSHAPLSDVHEMPECHPIKGNADSMKYHRPDSSGYEQTKAEVWFVSPSVAEAAGFVLAGSHPDGSSSADFEPGGTGHPCSGADVEGLGLGGLLLAGGAVGAVAAGAALLSDDDDITEDDITQDTISEEVAVEEVAAEEVAVEEVEIEADVLDPEAEIDTAKLDADIDEDRTIDSATLGVAAAGAGIVGAAALLGGDDETVEIETESADVELPEAEIEAELPDVELPEAEIEAELPEVELPEAEIEAELPEVDVVEPVEEIGDITVESIGRETVEIETDEDEGSGIGMGVAAAAGAAAVGAAALLGRDGDDDDVEIADVEVEDVTVEAEPRKIVAEVEAADRDVTRPAAVAAGATAAAGAAATRRVRDTDRKAAAAGDGGGAAAYTSGTSGGFGWGWLKWLLPLLLLAALLALLFWACSGDDEVAVPIAADPTSTAVPDPTATDVPEPTATSVPEPTATPVPEPTATPTPDPTATPTPEPEPTATPAPDPLYSRLAAAGYATLNEAVDGGVITFAGDTATFTDADTATMQAICDLIDGESLDQLQPIQWQSSGDDAVDADRANAINEFLASCNGEAGIELDALAPTPKFTG